ncbi:hypothetical protein ABZ135_36940 [Streptomyces sp. NPDC006339]|uniref:hypothetical protein n=1 Tax=Streptomyces sp. NPDC006339 TaxID=3156755 RepID=UPI0033B924B9
MTSFGDSVFERAQELPEEAVLPRPVVQNPELQPEDIGVLADLLLLPPDAQATAKALAAGMRARGWKMSIDRFEVIAKRLTKAGHVLRRSVYNPETKRPEWRYRAYRNPANNPQYVTAGTAALLQVSSEIGENPVPNVTPVRETGKNPVSPGQSRNRVFPGSGAESGKTRFPSDDVSAGQSRNPEKPGFPPPPPHPPGEVTTSPPKPPTNTTGHVPASPEGEGEGVSDSEKTGVPTQHFAAEDLKAASHFLQRMPAPWTQGRPNAERLAPHLLEAMEAQGWPSIHEVDVRLLAAHVGARPTGVTSPYRLLLRDRIPNLPLFQAVSGSGIPAQGSGSGPGPVPAADPGYKPVPPPPDVAAMLASLRKPTI